MLDFSIQFTCIIDEMDYNVEIIRSGGTVLKEPVTAIHCHFMYVILLNPDDLFVFWVLVVCVLI